MSNPKCKILNFVFPRRYLSRETRISFPQTRIRKQLQGSSKTFYSRTFYFWQKLFTFGINFLHFFSKTFSTKIKKLFTTYWIWHGNSLFFEVKHKKFCKISILHNLISYYLSQVRTFSLTGMTDYCTHCSTWIILV